MRGLHPLTRSPATRIVKGMNSSRRQFLARSAAGAAVIAGGSFTVSPLTALGATPITALTHVTVIDVATGRRR
jgi:secreted PhoX family phosphatase